MGKTHGSVGIDAFDMTWVTCVKCFVHVSLSRNSEEKKQITYPKQCRKLLQQIPVIRQKCQIFKVIALGDEVGNCLVEVQVRLARRPMRTTIRYRPS